MSIKPNYKTESYIKNITVINSQTVVECRFTLGDGISEILAVCPQVSSAGCEVSSGRVNYGGRLVCTAVCSDGRGKLNRAQKGAEFTHYADDDLLAPNQTATCKLNCERITVRRDGSSFLVTAVISAKIVVYGAAERNYLYSAEGAICNSDSAKFYSAVTFSGMSEVEDEFEAAGVEDILMHDTKVIVSDCRCGGGEVEVKGEIFLSLLALRDDEPVSLDRIIPFSAEIICDQALLNRRAVCSAQITDANVTAQINDDRGKCSVGFTANLSFEGVFFEESETTLVTDAFRKGGDVSLDFSDEDALTCDDVKVYSERVSGACAVKAKIDYNCAFKVVLNAGAECSYSESTGMLEGAVNAVLVYTQSGELKSSEISLPFSIKLNGMDAEECENSQIEVAVSGVSVRQRSEGELEAEATLRIAASVSTCKHCRYISRIEEGEDKETCEHAVTVLLPEEGQTLWEAAKSLKQSPEELSECCPNITFPLRGDERIVIYNAKKV